MMEILAADIGGTTTRFALYTAKDHQPVPASAAFTFATQGNGISSFLDFVEHYHAHKPDSLPTFVDVDRIVLAVPGPVSGQRSLLPNVNWDINLEDVPYRHILMLNDFTAQAHACLVPGIAGQFRVIREGTPNDPRCIGIIGAGTGLGHSCLVRHGNGFTSVPSESGYSCFAFNGEQEKRFEQFMLSRLDIPYIVNDVVVSGTGLTLLHEYITGEELNAVEVFDAGNAETLSLFSRFYGRVCRNYCLTNMIDKLIISGGIAMKHPDIVTCRTFLDEFLNAASPAYIPTLDNIPVLLNTFEDIGLAGAACFALVTTTGNVIDA